MTLRELLYEVGASEIDMVGEKELSLEVKVEAFGETFNISDIRFEYNDGNIVIVADA